MNKTIAISLASLAAAFSVCILVLSSQNKITSERTDARMDNLEENIKRLFQNGQNLSETTEKNTKTLFDNNAKMADALTEMDKRMRLYVDLQNFTKQQSLKKSLDLRGKSFGTFDTGSGLLFLIVEEVKPDKDGFILKAKVGNPNSITFLGLNITAGWNPGAFTDMPTGDGIKATDIEKWFDKMKEQWNKMPSLTTSIPQSISPGVWTPIEIPIRPVKFSELDNVFFDIGIKSVSLPDKQ